MTLSRRELLGSLTAAATAAAQAPAGMPIIDLHQHTHYWGRDNAGLRQHQKALGAFHTILLPAGSKYGLAADAWGNESCLRVVKESPGQFSTFANELPDITETRAVLEKFLKQGACGIGEQKFPIECDSAPMIRVYELAQEYKVPVLLHFEHEKYNLGYERFHKILARFPKVRFIGHAQTFWGYIDAKHNPSVLYPKGPVTPGGLTDKYLRDYANFFGDLSAGSGLNALIRDEDHARAFLERHQSKLIYGSDCQDIEGAGKTCSGSAQIQAILRFTSSDSARRRIFVENARRIIPLRTA